MAIEFIKSIKNGQIKRKRSGVRNETAFARNHFSVAE